MKVLIITAYLVLSAGIAHAQFESGCFYPILGVDIDTVYGSRNQQELGGYTNNIPQFPGENNRRIISYGLPKHLGIFSSFSTSTDLDIHDLQNVEETDLDFRGWIGTSYKFAHFRDTQHTDVIVFGEQYDTIFWADDNGRFNRTRFTTLRYNLKSDWTIDRMSFPLSYVARLTSDTVDDILFMVGTGNPGYRDTTYVVLYKGGSSLYHPGEMVTHDSAMSLGRYDSLEFSRYGTYADFRNSGRTDAVFFDYYSNGYFYENDPPFNMEKFANAIRFDTLLSRHENPKLHGLDSGSWSPFFFTMQAYRRNDPNDHSVDLMPSFGTDNDSTKSLWIYRGGPDFGKKRLMIDKPDFFMWKPSKYNSQFKGIFSFQALRDMGDMTGTGNRVLHSGGSSYSGFTGTHSFYVLGDAMNDKIDMYYQSEYDCGVPDTLTADSDNMQDIIIGNPCAKIQRDIDRDWDDVGYIAVLHGTSKIPVHLNNIASDRELKKLQATQLYASPNPLDQKTVLTFENCTKGILELRVFNSIGVTVLREEVVDVDGLHQYAVDMSSFPAGAYHIALSCPADGWRASVNVIKQGAAVTPWSLDLKKMVGR